MSKITFEIEEQEFNIPEVLTIENYSKVYKLKDFIEERYFQAKLVSAVTGANMDKVIQVNHTEINYISNYILSQFPNTDYPFFETFELNGVEYGFIPSWKNMSFAEFIDLDTLMNKKPEEIIENLHILCAIMYRPIISRKSKHDFKIEEYDAFIMQERAELFRKELDVKYVLGGNFFFSKFVKRFLDYSQHSLIQRMKTWITKMRMTWKYRKVIWTLLLRKPSDGMQFSTELHKMILRDIIKSSQKKSWRSSINTSILSKKKKN